MLLLHWLGFLTGEGSRTALRRCSPLRKQKWRRSGRRSRRPAYAQPSVCWTVETLEDRVLLSAVRAGFDDVAFPPNDDGSTPPVPLQFSAPIDFFGATHSDVYVNNNGNLTFDSRLGTFTPFELTSTNREIIAPFFADVHTGNHGDPVEYGPGSVDGRPAFGATWDNVDYFFSSSTHGTQLNSFQVVLIERFDTGLGNFDIEFNFDTIRWETGDASGGVGGLGGDSARVGFSNGTGAPGTFFELPGSGDPGSFLDSNTETGLIHNSISSDVLGRYVFEARGGAINRPPVADAGGPYEIVEGEPLTLDASGSSDPDGDALSFSWDLTGDGIFDDASGAMPAFSPSRLNVLGLDSAGSFELHVRVDDGQGGTATDTATLTIEPGPEVSGTKFEDVDGDGERDPDEPGLPGLTVFADVNHNGALDNGEPSTQTDADGHYTLTGLPPGTVSIGEVVPPGFVQTFPGRGRRVADESNDTVVTAVNTGLGPLAPGAFVDRGRIGDNPNLAQSDPALDVDLFALELDAGDRVIVDLDAREFGSSLDSILRLFDPDGVEVAFSDDRPALGESFTADSFLDFTASAAGTYFVGVSSFANGGYSPFQAGSGFFGFSTGDYEISIELIPGGTGGRPTIQNEANDTLNTALDTGLNSANRAFVDRGQIGDNPALAQFDPGLDVDLFELHLNPGDRLFVDVDAAESGSQLDSILRLFDSNGVEVAFNDNRPSPGEPFTFDSFLDFTASAAGTYFVGVSSWDNRSYDPSQAGSGAFGFFPGGYEISLEVVSPTHTVTLASGESRDGLDFGNLVLSEVSGTKFNDLNGNGLREADEPGVEGVLIFADRNNNGLFDRSTTRFATDVPQPIPDATTTFSHTPVSDIAGAVTDIDVTLDISHSFNPDLDVALVSPGGTRVQLLSHLGFSGGFRNTTLDDEAALAIDEGFDPFSGRFRPEQALSAFDGENANGPWRLEVTDSLPGDQGTLNGWSLTITTDATEESHTRTGADGGFTLRLRPGTQVIREVVPPGTVQTFPPDNDLLVNGGFETGDFAGWTANVTGSPFPPFGWQPFGVGANFGFGFASTDPQEGSFVAVNGFDGAAGTEFTLSQDVTIPQGAPAVLTWQDRIQWDFGLGGPAFEPRTFEVEVRDPVNDSLLDTLFTFQTGTQFSNPQGNTGFRTHTVDVSAFSGQTVRIVFRQTVPESGTGPALFELDAVSLLAPPTGDAHVLDLSSGETVTGVDFGNTSTETKSVRLNPPDPSVVSGEITSPGGSEIFRIDVPQNGILRTVLERIDGFNGSVRLLDEFGNVLVPASGTAQHPVLQGDRILAEVVGIDPATGTPSTGEFSLNIELFQDDFPDERNPQLTETIVLPGSPLLPLPGAINFPDDADVFVLGIADGAPIGQRGLVTIEQRAADGSRLDPLLRLFDGNGNEVASNDDGGPGLDSRLTHIVSPGDQFFLQAEAFASSTGAYVLTADLQPFEDSVGDTVGQAQFLPLDANGAGRVEGEINPGDDVDVFEVTAVRDGVLEIAQNGISTEGGSELSDPLLHVLDDGGNVLATNDDGGPGLDSLLRLPVSAGETVFIEAGSFSSNTGIYELTVTTTDPIGDDAPDDPTAADPPLLVPGSDGRVIQPGAIEVAGDRDVFRLDVANDGLLRIEQNRAGDGFLDSFLRLFNAAGEQIEFNDDGGPGLNSLIQRNVSAGETLLIQAGGFADFSTGGYDLIVELTSGAVPEDVPADLDPATAPLIELAATGTTEQAGTIDFGGDRDAFRIEIGDANAGTLNIRQQAPSGSFLDSFLRVFDADGRLIDSNDDSRGLDSSLAIGVEAGQTIFVQAGAFGSSTGDYVLSFSNVIDDFADALDPQTAPPIPLDGTGAGTQAGTIERSGDRDVFSVEFNQEGLVTIRQTAPAGSLLDSLLRVHRVVDEANGTTELIASNDDIGFSSVAEGFGFFDSAVTVEVAVGETLLVEAGAFGTSTGGYVVSLLPDQDDFPNDLNETAQSLSSDEFPGVRDLTRRPVQVDGVIEFEGDTDVFQFTADENMRIETRMAARNTRTFESGDINVVIPDDGPALVEDLTVSGLNAPVEDLQVTLNVDHTFDLDLAAFLISPSGTRVELFSAVGGSGDDFRNTTFDDESPVAISDGDAPFNGRFRPAEPLSAFDGLEGDDLNGTWQLEIEDTFGLDEGTLENWSLSITTNDPPTEEPVDSLLRVFRAVQDENGNPVRDENGDLALERVAVSDDDGAVPGDPATAGDSRVVLDVKAGERFFVEASGFGASTGTYTLTLNQLGGTGISTQTTVDQVSDTFAGAADVTLNEDGATTAPVSGTIQAFNDIDTFRLTAPRDGDLTVELTLSSGTNLNPRLAAFDDTLEHVRIASDFRSVDESQAPLRFEAETQRTVSIAVEAGETVFLQVSGKVPVDENGGLLVETPFEPFDFELSVQTSEPSEQGDDGLKIGEETGRSAEQAARQGIAEMLNSDDGSVGSSQTEEEGEVETGPNELTDVAMNVAEFIQQKLGGDADFLLLVLDPVDFVVTDAQSRQAGFTASEGAINEMGSETFFSGDGVVELLILPNPAGQTFNLELVGVGSGFRGSGVFVTGGGVQAEQSFAQATGLLKSNFEVVLDFTSPTTPGPGPGPQPPSNPPTGPDVANFFNFNLQDISGGGTSSSSGLSSLPGSTDITFASGAAGAVANVLLGLDAENLSSRVPRPVELLRQVQGEFHQTRQIVVESLRQSVGPEILDLLLPIEPENGEDETAAEFALLDTFWSGLRGRLLGVPSELFHLGEFLGDLLPDEEGTNDSTDSNQQREPKNNTTEASDAAQREKTARVEAPQRAGDEQTPRAAEKRGSRADARPGNERAGRARGERGRKTTG